MAIKIARKKSHFINFKLTAAIVAVLAFVVQPFIPLDVPSVFATGSSTVQPCTTTSVLETTDLSTWNLSETRDHGHNTLVSNGLHVWTDSNTSLDKAAGYLPATFDLADLGAGAGVVTVSGSGTLPSLQLYTDLDNDGNYDGYLVGEPAYYGEDTLWLSSNWRGIDLSGAPSRFNGGGTGKGGTVNEWLAAFPNAKIGAIGYSLGSGVHGDYIVSKITANCTDYTFTALPPNAPQNLMFSLSNTNKTLGQMWDGDNINTKPTNTGLDYIWAHWDNDPAVKYQITTYFKQSDGSWLKLHDSSAIKPTPYRFYGFGDEGDGVYRFRVAAYNQTTKLTSTYTNATLIYDTVKPTAPVITSPHSGDYFRTSPIRATWNASLDDNGIDQYQIQYIYGDGHTFAGTACDGTNACREVPGNQLYRDHNPGVTEQGTVTIRVRAIDKAGNVSDWSDPVEYTYDSTAPTNLKVKYLAEPSGDAVTNGGSVSEKDFKFLLSADGDPTRWQLKYWNDSEGSEASPFWAPTNISSTGHMTILGEYTDLFTRGEGTHYFQFSACDAAGNCSPFTSTFTVTFDNTAPVLGPITATDNGDGAWTISGTSDSSDPVTVTLNGSLIDTVNPDVDGNWSVLTGELDPDDYDVEATSVDSAGNASSPETTSFEVLDENNNSSQSTEGNGEGQQTITGTTPQAPAPINTFAATPFVAVLGASDDSTDNSTDGQIADNGATDTTIHGAEDDKSADSQKDSDSSSTPWYQLWYWWLLILAIIAALWWLLAGKKRRGEGSDV